MIQPILLGPFKKRSLLFEKWGWKIDQLWMNCNRSGTPMSLSCWTRDLVVAHPYSGLFVSYIPWPSRDVFLQFSNILHRLGRHVGIGWFRARFRGYNNDRGRRHPCPILLCRGRCPRRTWRHFNSKDLSTFDNDKAWKRLGKAVHSTSTISTIHTALSTVDSSHGPRL